MPTWIIIVLVCSGGNCQWSPQPTAYATQSICEQARLGTPDSHCVLQKFAAHWMNENPPHRF